MTEIEPADFESGDVCNLTIYMRSKEDMGEDTRRYIQTFWGEAQKIGRNPRKKVRTGLERKGMFSELDKELNPDKQYTEWRVMPDMELVPVDELVDVARNLSDKFGLPMYHTLGEIRIVCGLESYSIDGLALELSLGERVNPDVIQRGIQESGTGVHTIAKPDGDYLTIKWGDGEEVGGQTMITEDGLMLLTVEHTIQSLTEAGVDIEEAYLR